MTTCPIDDQPCEGACGPVNSDRCVELCAAGKNWMDHRNNRLMRKSVTSDRLAPVGAQHGARTFAMKLKCDCDLCTKYRKVQNKKDHERRKARMEGEGKGPERDWKHGTSYAWGERKCDCLVCLDHKNQYLKDKYQKEKAKRLSNAR